jgi:hypothetical protein
VANHYTNDEHKVAIACGAIHEGRGGNALEKAMMTALQINFALWGMIICASAELARCFY